MHGLHLSAELHGCPEAPDGRPLLTDAAALQALCERTIAAAGLTVVGELFHRFTPAPGQTQTGVTGLLLLAESHLALHTWPELGVVTLDVYVCNRDRDCGPAAQAVMDALIAAFQPARVERRAWARSAIAHSEPRIRTAGMDAR
ncbi:MAG TPA: adenosylmethionine decarboxylase [Burkholderiaceae bacterium]|nr:adenosylmethionine decarboxylase [Burkholderiaceae bacterium]HMX10949.1 adenosylmethionine decarboxylase [Burkholderiaceae bacterium]HMZ00467.1 adenosylmethionine decarboxylase [Burkholderiaceae bacterium]HNB46402.1 adenosylmethionine decarboxylase [Burkholderiaceae bacterium]HNG80946.1 adenosylmethionine decarboxylase [Burkholderiaceae bacterium]